VTAITKWRLAGNCRKTEKCAKFAGAAKVRRRPLQTAAKLGTFLAGGFFG
jgi:hypothetical protein